MVVPESVSAFNSVCGLMQNEDGSGLFSRIYSMPSLDQDQVRKLILSLASGYRASHMKELKEMTRIVDPENTIKTEKQGEDWRCHYTKLWQLHEEITNIDTAIVSVITRLCRGNPLLCLSYFVILLQSGYIKV